MRCDTCGQTIKKVEPPPKPDASYRPVTLQDQVQRAGYAHEPHFGVFIWLPWGEWSEFIPRYPENFNNLKRQG